MSGLDALASRAVYAARLFERVVNDVGPWTIRLHDDILPARRTLGESHVILSVTTPQPVRAGVEVRLYCADEMVSVRRLDAPVAEGETIEWAFGLAPVPA